MKRMYGHTEGNVSGKLSGSDVVVGGRGDGELQHDHTGQQRSVSGGSGGVVFNNTGVDGALETLGDNSGESVALARDGCEYGLLTAEEGELQVARVGGRSEVQIESGAGRG